MTIDAAFRLTHRDPKANTMCLKTKVMVIPTSQRGKLGVMSGNSRVSSLEKPGPNDPIDDQEWRVTGGTGYLSLFVTSSQRTPVPVPSPMKRINGCF